MNIKTGEKILLKKYLLFFLLFLLAFPLHVYPQYFGRNKVQYENFDWKDLKTKNFLLHFYPEEKEAAYDAAIMLERWNGRFAKIFGDSIGPEQPIVLYANHTDFQQTNVISGAISQGTGGVTEGLLNRIVLPFTGVYTENDHVLGHELVHAFQYNIIKSSRRGLAGAGGVPLWFVEGLAEYLSIGKQSTLTSMWLRDAVLNDDIPEIDDLATNYKYFPYRYGHAVWNYITSIYGDEVIAPLFRTALDSGFAPAFKHILKIDLDTLSEHWQTSVKEIYAEQLKDKTKPADIGKTIRGSEQEEGDINLSPVISPDGKYIAVITRETLFTLDLYLIDAETGEVIQQLASSATDSHFDALRFMNSSGAWSPDSKRFAFPVIEDGDDKVAVMDIESESFLFVKKIDDIDAITNLAWSPDGNNLIVSGSFGGINDLYLYDFSTDKTIRLTNDKYTELHPSYSPDGKYLAFATDRGELSDTSTYLFNSMNIAVMNLETKEIELIKIEEGITHINPLFSGNGENLIFISNADGINNIYRYNFNNKTFYKITDAATGISGLTELSHAMSLSFKTGRLVFTVFDNTGLDIHSLDNVDTAGVKFEFNRQLFITNTTLPPAKLNVESIVEAYLESPVNDLPETLEPEVSDYSPQLDLLYIGEIYVGVAVDRFGSGVGGGVSTLFSDLLGDHMIAAQLQANGGLKDIGGQAMYLNLSSRWNWGGAIGHIPYLTGFVGAGFDSANVNGRVIPVQTFSIFRQRVFLDRIAFLSQYPLSVNRRIEFSAGYSRISYDFEEQRLISDLNGFIIGEEERSLPSPPALNLFTALAAYVGDYSFFGFTSPIDGSSYRFEAEQTFGTLDYLSILADYRHYFFFNPFTLAFRGLHYGRYLNDAEDPKLTPLQIGYDTWVRGYSFDSFDVSECTGENGDCPEIDRLLGSKIGIFNMEFRVPLFGVEQFGIINFPYLPTELSLFFDAGVAWTNNEKPELEFVQNSGKRIPVFSAGGAARINLLGYIVLQFYYAFPFQRPAQRDGIFGFLISPGW